MRNMLPPVSSSPPSRSLCSYCSCGRCVLQVYEQEEEKGDDELPLNAIVLMPIFLEVFSSSSIPCQCHFFAPREHSSRAADNKKTSRPVWYSCISPFSRCPNYHMGFSSFIYTHSQLFFLLLLLLSCARSLAACLRPNRASGREDEESTFATIRQ
jgi:hypothetical protein